MQRTVWGEAAAARATDELLDSDAAPTAIFAHSDELAMGAMGAILAARELGIVSTARIRQWHLDLAMLGKTIPNPWRKELADATPIQITTGLNLTFAPRELKVKAGQPVKLTFINPDAVPHNWVLIQPGKLLEVGDLTNKMVADPAAVFRQDPAAPSLQLTNQPPYTNQNPRQMARVLVFSQPGQSASPKPQASGAAAVWPQSGD